MSPMDVSRVAIESSCRCLVSHPQSPSVLRRRTGVLLAGALLFGVTWGSAIANAQTSQEPSASEAQSSEPAQEGPDSAQADAAVVPRYTFRRAHDPNGIGKFYMGREIARVMGFGFQGSGARWLEREEREREERLQLLVKSLALKPEMTVADIGAGSGVISLLIAEQLSDKGKVLAVDIQKEMLDRLQERAKAAGIKNIQTVRGERKSPNLPPESVDLAIMVDVYHEFDFPYEMLKEISRSLKPGGRVAFVEYRMEDPTVPIKLVHKMSEAQVKKEASQPEFGLKFQKTIGVLPWQHIVVFEKQSTAR